MQEKVFRITKASPAINKAEIGRLCGLTTRGVRYHIEKLRKEKNHIGKDKVSMDDGCGKMNSTKSQKLIRAVFID